MNTTGERVEVTPELLADLEDAALDGGAKYGEHWVRVLNRKAGTAFGQEVAFEVRGAGKLGRRRLVFAAREEVAGYVVAAQPSIVLALVARIRELESEREAFTPEMVESINECIGAGISWSSMHGDPVDTDGADAARSLIESILLKRP